MIERFCLVSERAYIVSYFSTPTAVLILLNIRYINLSQHCILTSLSMLLLCFVSSAQARSAIYHVATETKPTRDVWTLR